MSIATFTPKRMLGYYLAPVFGGESLRIPIYGLRAVPTEVLNRVPPGFADRHWQVEVLFHPEVSGNEYVWVNQERHRVYLY